MVSLSIFQRRVNRPEPSSTSIVAGRRLGAASSGAPDAMQKRSERVKVLPIKFSLIITTWPEPCSGRRVVRALSRAGVRRIAQPPSEATLRMLSRPAESRLAAPYCLPDYLPDFGGRPGGGNGFQEFRFFLPFVSSGVIRDI